MTVSLAGEGGIVVGEGTAERIAGTLSHCRRESSGIARGLSVGAASTGGACRLAAQRSIRMPHFVCPEAGGDLRVCYPLPLGSKLLVVVEANDGGEQEVWSGVHRLTLPVAAPISFDLSKRKTENLPDLMYRFAVAYAIGR